MPEDNYDENSSIAEMQERLTELQRENREIRQAITEIAQANVLPGIMQNGFDDVIAELRPLRDLAPGASRYLGERRTPRRPCSRP